MTHHRQPLQRQAPRSASLNVIGPLPANSRDQLAEAARAQPGKRACPRRLRRRDHSRHTKIIPARSQAWAHSHRHSSHHKSMFWWTRSRKQLEWPYTSCRTLLECAGPSRSSFASWSCSRSTTSQQKQQVGFRSNDALPRSLANGAHRTLRPERHAKSGQSLLRDHECYQSLSCNLPQTQRWPSKRGAPGNHGDE